MEFPTLSTRHVAATANIVHRALLLGKPKAWIGGPPETTAPGAGVTHRLSARYHRLFAPDSPTTTVLAATPHRIDFRPGPCKWPRS
jgi:hypothetical protein